MKLLVITNYYPPHYFGGYELGCHDVVEQLKARGHPTTVLTSTHGATATALEPDVLRWLSIRGPQTGTPSPRSNDAGALSKAIDRARPDLVYFWNQAGLSLRLAVRTRRRVRCRAFFLSDTSFVSWRTRAYLRRLVEPRSASPPVAAAQNFLRAALGTSPLLVGRPIMEGERCHFASAFLAGVATRAGIQPSLSEVVHWGVDPSLFRARERVRPGQCQRFLVVGQIIPQKGTHTVIEAFRRFLADAGPGCAATLSIAGGTSNPSYEAEVRESVRRHGLEQAIHFCGKIPRTALPQLYAEHDALIFPSEWEEPFAITPLEAMASGLAVLATATGGSAEIFRHRENALVFPAGDATACAAAIAELHGDAGLCARLRAEGHRLVTSAFTLDRMVDTIEESLLHSLENSV